MPAPGFEHPVAGIRKRIVRFFDNRFGKVAKALGEKTIFYGQATKGVCVDALAQAGDEGRGQLRKASGSCKQAVIRGCPNGETRPV